METNTIGWIGLISVLFITSFGVSWLLAIIVGSILFIIGCFSLLYVQQGDVEKFYSKCAGNPLTSDIPNEGGLKHVVRQIESPKKVQKTDNRVTGSELIDSSLQEILGYVIRDYVSSWYTLISRDTEFMEVTVRHTAQTFAINIANRVKEVDWIPFLTQRLVDDAASHLRLYKQARTKMKLQEASKEQNSSPQRDSRSPKKSNHKRNKSETDINWYSKKSTDLKRDTERNVGNSKFYISDKKDHTLEDYFFDLERQMENNLVCRDCICQSTENEKEFLCEIVEILLYILLPDEDFQCRPLRFLLREIFVNCVILPLFNLIADPDYINQVIIWLCLREAQLPSDIFLTTLRLTDSCDELKSTKELVTKEIHSLRSRDSGGDSDLSIKQQLSSLYYVLKLIDNKLSKMENTDSLDTDAHSSLDYFQLESIKKIDLKLDQILKNNIAFSYFIDFVSMQGKQVELFFYLNVEGWKVSVEQQISDLHLNRTKLSTENVSSIYESIRSTALSIYEQYLGEKCEQKILLKQSLVQELYFKIRNLNETPSELWFDKILEAMYEKIEKEFLPSFKKSKAYIKLLQELDLLQQATAEEDAISINSTDSLENNEASKFSDNLSHLTQISKKGELLTVDSTQKSVKHARSLSDVTMFTGKNDTDLKSRSSSQDSKKIKIVADSLDIEEEALKTAERCLKTGDYVLSVNIIETGIVCEKGKTFGIYAVRVTRQFETGYSEEWHIYRRYSDFHDLYTKVKEKFPDLSKLTFPGKKTFHNMDRSVLERRMKMLGSYMHELCQSQVISSHHTLRELLMTFLEQGDYDRATGGPIASTIDSLVNPLKSGMKTIKNMPEQLFNTVDEVVVGLTKVFHNKPGRLPEASKVGASIEETDDNIPLRIMLLLMDEVFDLKSRNQWLRRRIVTLLRQIVRTMFGDIVNRRILDYVSFITSPKNVAHYLYVFKIFPLVLGNRFGQMESATRQKLKEMRTPKIERELPLKLPSCLACQMN
ncbi:sorting nexin-13 isoform X2 [Anoplophora glabripennis]|uniref:sorting nexin-13 isoform X2 n=1 Tax=Anoplophora glabripennis TaxID=217634 RepID=UPI000873F28F|nr:sorting nexin-13 isoform X2 [Anoplophora glabripennis]